MSNTLDSLRVNGAFSCQSATLPSGCVTASNIVSAAGVEATKLQQQYARFYAQPHGTAATSERIPIHNVYGATGTLVELVAGVVVAAAGAATVSIQLKKNGSNILSSALVIDNSNSAFAEEATTSFTSTSLVEGDVLELDITATAGGGTLPQGLYVTLIVREDPQ